MLRPDGIGDLRHRVDRDTVRGPRATKAATAQPRVGSVCRYDIAASCRAAVEPGSAAAHPFEVLHVATVDTSLPEAERADAFCNVGRTQQVLGVSFRHNLAAQFPPTASL